MFMQPTLYSWDTWKNSNCFRKLDSCSLKVESVTFSTDSTMLGSMQMFLSIGFSAAGVVGAVYSLSVASLGLMNGPMCQWSNINNIIPRWGTPFANRYRLHTFHIFTWHWFENCIYKITLTLTLNWNVPLFTFDFTTQLLTETTASNFPLLQFWELPVRWRHVEVV